MNTSAVFPHLPQLPHGATDVHVHVFDPQRFAYVPARSYTPGVAQVEALLAHASSLGVARWVLVQPSVYGTDNACLLDALAVLGPKRGRGIAVVDVERVTPADLADLHAAGVRGIRLNFEVRHEASAAQAVQALRRAAEVLGRGVGHGVGQAGWCIQVHVGAALLPELAPVMADLPLPVVLDHFGGLSPADAASNSEPMQAMLRLLSTGNAYLKLSAPYRMGTDAPHYASLTALARALINARPDRMLWGSDWPHTGGGAGSYQHRDPAQIEPFRRVDLQATLAALADWCADAATLRRILVDNPATLYGFDRHSTGDLA